MTVPLGPAGALRIAYELIDAQAAHIKNLERGHWSRETRALVEDKRDELEAAQKATDAGSCCAAGACEPCEQDIVDVESPTIDDLLQGNTPEECPHGFHPTSCGMCTGPAAAYPSEPHLGCITGLPADSCGRLPNGYCACPAANGPLFDKGGELPTGLSYRQHRDPILRNLEIAMDQRTTISSPGDPGHPVIGNLDVTCPSSCAATHPGQEHPAGHTGPHQPYHYPPKGQCPRCDYIRQATQA